MTQKRSGFCIVDFDDMTVMTVGSIVAVNPQVTLKQPMRKSVLLTLGLIASALFSAHAQNIKMFTTESDWTNWNSSGTLTFQATNALDLDGATVNGIGGADAGATSIGGSLQVSPIVPCNWGQAGPVFAVTGANGAVLNALVGPDAAYGSPLPAQTGTMYVDYTLPDNSVAGSWFAMGIFIQYNDHWGLGGQDWAPADLGPVSTPTGTQELYRATIPYTISAFTNNLTYFSLGFWVFTDRQGTNVWYIDNISVAPLPATIIPAAVHPLFNTYDDFTNGWTASGGDLIQATNDWSLNGSTTNGLGNTNAPGATGATSGSLLVYWSSIETGFGTIAAGPNEQDNPAFLQAIAPGYDTYTLASPGAYGNLYVTYSQPDNSQGGNYFQLGMALSYAGNGYSYWNNSIFFPSKTTDLNMQDNNGYEVYQATIPYNIQAGYLYGFTPYIFVNSNYQPTNGFRIDNISVSSAPTPILSADMNGTNVVIQGTNGLTGRKYSLLSTTNLMLPITNWTTVSVGVSFNGPTFSATNGASSPSSFYKIKVQ